MRFRWLSAAALLAAANAARAQLVPNDEWRTLQTKHFRVHFTKPLEPLGRRAAVNAERAYTELSRELVPPRGIIDLVVADNVDYVNGYATTFPTNRIVVYAHPPTDVSGLRYYEDWNALVVTHELTHIFHLDRTRGIWSLGQAIFGRNPLLFPNQYEPRWVLEGLAVYYESRLTGVGRLESSEHSMTARAAALENKVPTLQELAPQTSRFPGGEVIYVYGSLMFDYLSRTRGPQTIRAFVEHGAKSLLPFFLTPTSRAAFGESFQTAWEQWRDSLVSEMRTPHQVMPDWRQLTTAGRLALYPRWDNPSTLIYSGDKGREVPAAYSLSLDGKETRLGRRNGTSPNVRLADGSIFFTQPDYTDPYHWREDLYVERNGHETRLTRGARLTWPDVRPDGEIVATQNLAGTTRLVRVSRDGSNITPLTESTLDTQYSEPRWSPDGTRIVAVAQTRGVSELIVLDTSGRVMMTFAATRAINSGPTWSADGRRILFSSEESGSPQLYIADTFTSPPSLWRITDAPTGVFSPELSPDNNQLASVLFRADGYHIGVAPFSFRTAFPTADTTRVSPREGCAACLSTIEGVPVLGTSDTGVVRKYSPWLSLLPRYWLPVLEGNSVDGTSFGAATSGTDIVGRHNFSAEVLRNTRFGENSAYLFYRYAGFGLPLLDLSLWQDYSRSPFGLIIQPDTAYGYFLQRRRVLSLQSTFVRPRVRTYAVASLGGEIENLAYATSPDTLLRHLSSFYSRSRNYPAITGSLGWSNVQRPELSISAEDGISASLSGRQRWQSGTTGASTRVAIGVASAYKSIDLPGFAHHVFAVRAAGGITDDRSPDLFHAGGISGSSLSLIPGYAIGTPGRTFGVRGYPASAESGIHAYSASAEYRVPLAEPSRGFRFIPVFIDKLSATFFGETGRAFCPASASNNGICGAASTSPAENPVMTSVGAELNFDTGFQLDLPARLRLGTALPLANRELLGAKGAEFYVTFGSSF